jgi:aminoglycoside phosphotransferase (APT) family kinase protein
MAEAALQPTGPAATPGLSDWLREHVPGFQPPFRLHPIAGGQSNPTYRLSAASGEYVLRSKPVGVVLPSAHAVDREFRVMRALATAGVPVPRVHALCADESILGSIFYVMDFVPGRVFFDPRLPDLTQPERAAVFDSMNATIATLHSLDPEALGLGDFGRAGSYLERQVVRWTKQYPIRRWSA